MAGRDESGERTEMPTLLRLKEARQRGQVARSGDLSSALLVLGGLAVLAALGPALVTGLTRMTAAMLAESTALQPGSPAELVSAAVGPVLWTLAALAGAVVILAIVAGVIQVGLLFSGEPLSPDFSRLSPGKGLRRIFSGRSVVRGGLAVCKLAAAGVLCWVSVASALPRIVRAGRLSSADVGPWCGRLVLNTSLRVAVALLVLAVVDYLYQRWQHRQDLKMTRREYLDDLRRMEGDPLIRRRQRKEISKRRGFSPPKHDRQSH